MARLEEEAREQSYRRYLTDALFAISRNTANYAGGGHMVQRWSDLLDRPPADDRPREVILAEAVERSGVILKKGGGG